MSCLCPCGFPWGSLVSSQKDSQKWTGDSKLPLGRSVCVCEWMVPYAGPASDPGCIHTSFPMFPLRIHHNPEDEWMNITKKLLKKVFNKAWCNCCSCLHYQFRKVNRFAQEGRATQWERTTNKWWWWWWLTMHLHIIYFSLHSQQASLSITKHPSTEVHLLQWCWWCSLKEI